MLTTAGTVTADVPSVRQWAQTVVMREILDRQRHVDIGFLAASTPRREQLIARAAGLLWEWRTDLRFTVNASNTSNLPVIDASCSSLADTRILLNVHGGNETGFDWARAVEAMANGCVLASETSVGYAPLVPGVHFLMAPYESLVERAVALAFDEPRRAAMAEAAYALAATGMPTTQPAQVTVERARTAPRRRRKVSPATDSQGLPRMLSELKAAYLAQVEMTRSIEATISLVEHGDPHHTDVVSSSAWPSFDPEVSVVIALYNEERHLADTVHSVIAASGESGPRTELLIVDDHSTDDSRHLAERLLEAIDWYPATLMARAANGGPAVARNVGFNAARASHVLVLDAGSTLYPTGLRRLLDGLLDAPSDVVATYGIVEQFDTTGPLGLSSHLPWSAELLVQGAFVDAAALFRRQAWTDIGGYRTPADGVEDGWEEYDLWLAVAERDLRAEHVGSVVARHRRRPAAMLEISDVDVASTFLILRERHPRLPWPS